MDRLSVLGLYVLLIAGVCYLCDTLDATTEAVTLQAANISSA